MSLPVDSDHESYWQEYDGLQHAKHQLLHRYLGGWFPKLASWTGRVLYMDFHAGRGRHATGQEGSSILATRRLLEHSHCSRILASTKVQFIFFEIDRANYSALLAEIESLKPLPPGVQIIPIHADYEKGVHSILDDLKVQKQSLAPTFGFVDPFGFKLSMELINELLQFPHCELLINFMYRYVDMAMHQDSQAKNLDALFGCQDWRKLRMITDPEERATATIALFAEQLQAKFVTNMHMKAANGVLKYVLFHAANHPEGRKLMKEAMWAVTPDGSFTVFEQNDPNQLVLITPEPNLELLEDRLWVHFVGRQVSMEELYEWLVGELYLEKHLHDLLRRYREQGIVTFSRYQGRFAFNKNPTVHFPPQRPAGS